MTKYMIELHHVPHELAMYVEELKLYGEIDHYNERFPTVIWLISPWDIDAFDDMYGVKSVRAPLVHTGNAESTIKDIMMERGL